MNMARRSILIKDTTREERIRIVSQALNCGGESSCDMCNGCTMGIVSIDKMFQPYIDGEMELREVNMRNATRKYVHG